VEQIYETQIDWYSVQIDAPKFGFVTTTKRKEINTKRKTIWTLKMGNHGLHANVPSVKRFIRLK